MVIPKFLAQNMIFVCFLLFFGARKKRKSTGALRPPKRWEFLLSSLRSPCPSSPHEAPGLQLLEATDAATGELNRWLVAPVNRSCFVLKLLTLVQSESFKSVYSTILQTNQLKKEKKARLRAGRETHFLDLVFPGIVPSTENWVLEVKTCVKHIELCTSELLRPQKRAVLSVKTNASTGVFLQCFLSP